MKMSWLPDSVVDHLREAVTLPDFSATRYELIDEIGRGGMGAVYVGGDTQLDRRVALKVLTVVDADGQAAARMAEEARILARLEHPGIVPIHDLGRLPDGRIFYAMKMVEGQRLDAYARSNATLQERLRVFLRICETMAFAHSEGIIHRDLKPENIMVGRFGEVLVLDWGVAKITGIAREFAAAGAPARSDTARGTVIGTPDFMAPEQAAGAIDQVDARSDIFSLGKTLAALFAGADPPKRLQAIAAKAASPERAARYAGALELSTDIGRPRRRARPRLSRDSTGTSSPAYPSQSGIGAPGRRISADAHCAIFLHAALNESGETRNRRLRGRKRSRKRRRQMNKPLFGLLLGGILGIFDGLSAWFYPEVRAQIMGIVIGSTFKGLITGVCIGYFAKKVNSLGLEILFGLAVGMFLAFLVAAMPNPAGSTTTSRSCCLAASLGQWLVSPRNDIEARV